MKFRFEGINDIVEINFDFIRYSEFIKMMEPDLESIIDIMEKFEIDKLIDFKRILEKISSKKVLFDFEKECFLGFRFYNLKKYFRFNKSFYEILKPNQYVVCSNRIDLDNGYSKVYEEDFKIFISEKEKEAIGFINRLLKKSGYPYKTYFNEKFGEDEFDIFIMSGETIHKPSDSGYAYYYSIKLLRDEIE